MDLEIIQLLALVKAKINRDVRVFTESDDKFYSTSDGETIDRPEYKVMGVMSDSARHKTYFRFRRRAESYVGYIDGDGENERATAGLIATILENGVIRESSGKGDTLKSIVLGESNGIQIQKYMRKVAIPDLPCSVFVIYASNGRIADVVNFLENFKSNSSDRITAIDEMTCAYVCFQENVQSETEYQSLSDYAHLLVQSAQEEIGISLKVGVGSTVHTFNDCAISYQQAVSAVRMGNIFESKSSVSTYKEYVLVKMLEDLPKYKLQEFLDILLEPESKTIFGDNEMVATAEEFLHNSLNVSETARNLYMHRNTLMYRLDKIDRATGLDIRKFQDAIMFKLIMILYRLLG